MHVRTQRISVPWPNGSSVGAKLTKASIDLRRGGDCRYQTPSSAIRSIAALSLSTQPASKSLIYYVDAETCDCSQLIDNHSVRPRASASSRPSISQGFATGNSIEFRPAASKDN